MGVSTGRIDLQCMIKGLDCIREFFQFLVGSRLVIERTDVVGTFGNRAVKVNDGIAESVKVKQGKSFPQPRIRVFRL